MPPDPASAVAIKVGMEIFTRVTPRGFAWIKSKWVGRDLLVVGQARAGKTSLVRYIQYGVFAEQETTRTRTVKKTAAFSVKVGRDKSLALEVRKAIDTVGQVSAEAHAGLAKTYKPHAILVVIDMSGAWESKDDNNARHYLEEFFEYLSSTYQKSRSLKRKLKAVYIVANKRDRVDPKRASSFLKKMNEFVRSKQQAKFGVDTIDCYVLESSLVEAFDEGKSANNVIQKLALKLNEG
ncbi:Gtr1/RagA G protein conserved region [Bradyrhizobium sp. YR681]|uniref:GTPase n=1 Tax=Bradyrhizobium sp. YR681 TaxID=1144344 RepID=UPI00026FC2F9|nr:GTPase [Bradyrhizobium sp. YR681]EJN07453.1 Gtr1/RagA G protein conserved region [Bradyrhizobium sp. YR681]